MKIRACPECKTYLSEDSNAYYCTECDYEELKVKPYYWKGEE